MTIKHDYIFDSVLINTFVQNQIKLREKTKTKPRYPLDTTKVYTCMHIYSNICDSSKYKTKYYFCNIMTSFHPLVLALCSESITSGVS